MTLKKILIVALCSASLCTFSCKESTTKKNIPEATETPNTTNEANEGDVIDTSNDPILLGKTKRSQLLEIPYSKWFMPTYEEYVVDTVTVKVIEGKLRDAHLTIFMGTWCQDSQLQIPAVFKVLDKAGFNPNHYTLITVSEEKDTPNGLEKDKDINFVPTIIVSMEGEEIGRIVEYPIENLEKDLEKILNGAPYKHAYED
ncbi:MAG: thiol-disulfide isomerase/thioredoxin [Flavobacteriales bacterium]|jgi:thiol-disulfide isomerase/thioredoxin